VTLTVFLLTLAVMVLASILWVAFGRVREVASQGALDDDLSGEARWATLDDLTRRKAVLQQELKEIELDLEMGKIDRDDYARSKRRFERMWLAADDQLQAILGESAAYRAQIESELARRAPAREAGADDAATARPARPVCARCGSVWIAADGACQSCGELKVAA
jgi:hypothetical protein